MTWCTSSRCSPRSLEKSSETRHTLDLPKKQRKRTAKTRQGRTAPSATWNSSHNPRNRSYGAERRADRISTSCALIPGQRAAAESGQLVQFAGVNGKVTTRKWLLLLARIRALRERDMLMLRASLALAEFEVSSLIFFSFSSRSLCVCVCVCGVCVGQCRCQG